MLINLRLTKTNRIWGSLRSSNHIYIILNRAPKLHSGRKEGRKHSGRLWRGIAFMPKKASIIRPLLALLKYSYYSLLSTLKRTCGLLKCPQSKERSSQVFSNQSTPLIISLPRLRLRGSQAGLRTGVNCDNQGSKTEGTSRGCPPGIFTLHATGPATIQLNRNVPATRDPHRLRHYTAHTRRWSLSSLEPPTHPTPHPTPPPVPPAPACLS